MNPAPTNRSTRATIDVINFWCIAILIVSAVSVAGVVGAAVVAGEFDTGGFNSTQPSNATDARVLTEVNPDGTKTITWSDPGDAALLEIREGGQLLETLDFVGDEATVESSRYVVRALYPDGSTAVVQRYP